MTGDDDTIESDVGYGDALDELEDLLDELEGADVDVDILAKRVARGVELIRLCRARLDVVTADVDAVVAELMSMDRVDSKESDDEGREEDDECLAIDPGDEEAE